MHTSWGTSRENYSGMWLQNYNIVGIIQILWQVHATGVLGRASRNTGKEGRRGWKLPFSSISISDLLRSPAGCGVIRLVTLGSEERPVRVSL